MLNYLTKLLFLTFIFGLTGCGGGGGSSDDSGTTGTTGTTGNIPSDLQGQWMLVHNGEKTFLGPNTQKSITVIDDNLIQDNDSTSNPYLVRAGINEVTTSGQANSDSVSKSMKAFSGVGGIDIILKNINDSSVSIQTSTQSSGKFSLKAPSGSYTLTATDANTNAVTTNVTIQNKAIDLGEFTVVNKSVIAHNFKSTILNNEPQYFGTLDGQTEKTYSKTLQITNIGSQAVSGVTFSLTMSNSAVRNFTFSSKIIGMEPGASVSIPVTFSFKRPDVDTEIPLNVTIKDRFNNEWTDHTSLKLMSKNESVEINVQVTGATGHIITQGRTPQTLPAIIPYKAGNEYEIVLSALTSNNESAYSLGVGVAPGSTSGFNEPNKFEPDDSTVQANEIGLYETKTSFLFGGDIDFYKLKFKSEETPFDPKLISTLSSNAFGGLFIKDNIAYIAGFQSGFFIIDITNPLSPIIVGSVDTPGNALDVFVIGNTAYVADSSSGLQVIDISNIGSPIIVGSIKTPHNAKKVFVLGNHAYVADGNNKSTNDTDGGLYIIDISVPNSPAIIGSLDLSVSTHSVHVIANIAYITSSSTTSENDLDLKLIDISTPNSPSVISSINIPGSASNAFISGNFAYVVSNSGFYIVDISTPSSPKIVGDINGESTGIYGIFVSNNFAYVSKIDDGNASTINDGYIKYHIINVKNPTSPVIVNTIDFTGQLNNIFVVDNYVYVVSTTGLHVFQLK
ncbi:MAG: hypothetical protein HN826_08860 [Methylococcales bacterium]|jgi:hypothetical protein|nr:hypothetical protein [Methylococcales bacterium]